MKLKKDFVLRKIAGTWAVMAVGAETINFHKMLTLNDSGAMLWNLLAEGKGQEELADALVAEYDVERTIALADAEEFMQMLHKAGCME